MSKHQLVIDIGSKKICIYKKDSGLVLKEPSVLIVENRKGELYPVVCGQEAIKRVGKLTENQQLVMPIKEGAVISEKAFEFLLRAYLERVAPKRFLRPNVQAMVCISCGLSNIEKRTVEEICLKAGIADVTLVESPIAVAALRNNDALFIVDFGGQKSEIAVIGTKGIVAGCSIDIGGDKLNQAIADYVCDKYRVMIQPNTAEKIKLGAGSFLDNDLSTATVSGKSIFDQKPKSIEFHACEIREALQPSIDKLAEVIESVTLMIPEHMGEQIYRGGIYLCGGGANLPGLDRYLTNRLKISINLLESPDEAVAMGGAKYFYDARRLREMLNMEHSNYKKS